MLYYFISPKSIVFCMSFSQELCCLTLEPHLDPMGNPAFLVFLSPITCGSYLSQLCCSWVLPHPAVVL